MSAFESGSDPVTVMRPRASGRNIALVGLLVVFGVFGDLLEVLAYLFAPLTKVPAVRRWLEKDDVVPDQLEVRSGSVTTVGSQAGGAIRRVDGAVLTVRDVEGSPALHIAGTADADATIDLGRYDVDEVGRAVLAHGWPWQPAGSAVIYPSAPAVAVGADESSPDFEVVLRDGWTRPVPAPAITAMVFGGVVLAIVANIVAYFMGVSQLLAVIVVAVLIALCVVVIALVWHRLSRVTFAVDRQRIVVRYGAISKLVVHRNSVVSAVAGRRLVRLREHGRWRSTYLPIAPRRRELVTALGAYGWPVTDGG